MADIKITDLTAAQAATADDLFEIAQPSGNDFVSLKLTAAQLATLIAAVQTYSGLTTTAQTLVGSLNELDATDGKVVQTATPSGTATTYNYPVLLSNANVTPNSDPSTTTDSARASGGLFFAPNMGALNVRRIHTDTATQSSLVVVGNAVADGTAGATDGRVRVYGKGTKFFQLADVNNVLTSDRTFNAQDLSGTIALLENIYTIAGRVSTIVSGANLNSAAYTAPGRYYCNATNAATLSNSPITDTAFVMDVLNCTGSGMSTVTDTASSYRKRIIYTAYSTDARRYEQTCWSNSSSVASYGSWIKYLFDNDESTGTLITNTTGVVFDESFCKQCGKTVNVRAWISGLSTTTQTHDRVIYVQSVDMPTTPVRFVFTCWLGNGIAAYAGYGVMDTSGRISLVKAVANSDKASFEFTYNV